MTQMQVPPRIIFFSALLILSWLAALALTPRKLSPVVAAGMDLQEIIPTEFSDWTVDSRIRPIQAVETGSLADKIYDQTVSRGYRNSSGDLIMVVIAYGRNQSDTLQIHRPEVCYVANGFSVSEVRRHDLQIGRQADMTLPILRLETSNYNHHEPVSYWTRIGDALPVDNLSRQFHKISYGLTGRIPDGILVRISSIDRNSERAFQNHDIFIRQLLNAIREENRPLLIGALAANSYGRPTEETDGGAKSYGAN